MPPTTRSQARAYREERAKDPRIDVLAYPHLVDMILDHLPREDIVVLRSVSRSYRQHVDRLLYRHLVVRSDGYFDEDIGDWVWDEHPVRIHMPNEQGPAVPWRALKGSDRTNTSLVSENNNYLSQMRQMCRVLDVEGATIRQSMSLPISELKTLANVNTLRRFEQESFMFGVDAIIDFAGANPQQLQLAVRCKRYVASGLEYPYCDCWDHEGHFTTRNIVLSRFKGLEEVVLLYAQDQKPIESVFPFLRGYQHMFKSAAFTVVGLAKRAAASASGDVGDTGKTLSEYFKVRFLEAFFTIPSAEVLSAVTFMNHDEYRQSVGEEQYLLETEKGACFM